MAHSSSAKKSIRQNAKRYQRNRAYRTRYRRLVRKTQAALESGDATAAEATVQQTVSVLDDTAGKGIIHPNKAARLKSRLVRRLNALKQAQGEAE